MYCNGDDGIWTDFQKKIVVCNLKWADPISLHYAGTTEWESNNYRWSGRFERDNETFFQ